MNFLASTKEKRAFLYIALFLFFIALDQSSKLYFFPKSLSSTCNQHLSLNIPLNDAIFGLAWIILLAGLVYVWLEFPKKPTLGHFFWILVFSGAISNIIDRLLFDCVRDFIPFIQNIFIFNLADALISIGVGGIFYVFFLKS